MLSIEYHLFLVPKRMSTNNSTQLNSQQDNSHYVVFARRTRPQSFSNLVGQEVVSKAIEKMLSHQKIPHAFLFTGTRGTGKTSSARILAKSLCCISGPTIHPCQTCIHCTQITACAHDDILEIDGASHTGVDNIRELREATRFFPNSARYKIFIIDEVHMLSTGAFNALLKTLEEPPPNVIFILATTELHKVPITVRSRCMIFAFKKIETVIIEEHLKQILLKENISFENDAITLIAREAKGSMRDALSLLEQITAICNHASITTELTKKSLCVQGEEIAEQIFLSICQKDMVNALTLLKQADVASIDFSVLFDNIAQFFRNSLLIKSLNNKENALKVTQLLPNEYYTLEKAITHLSIAALSEIFKLLASCAKDLIKTNVPLAWAEIIIIDCISRADWLSASEIISLLNDNSNKLQAHETLPSNLATRKIDNSPIPPAISKQNMQQEMAGLTDLSSKELDVQLFKKFVNVAEQKSKTLAARLAVVKIEHFNSRCVQFADALENETFLSFNEHDLQHFWDSIDEIQLNTAEFKGRYTPKPNKKSEIRQNISQQIVVEQKPILNKTSNSSKKLVNKTENLMQSFQKYSGNQSQKHLGNEALTKVQTKSISLSEIQTHEKNQGFLQQEKELLEKEHVQKLKKLATEIQIVSVD